MEFYKSFESQMLEETLSSFAILLIFSIYTVVMLNLLGYKPRIDDELSRFFYEKLEGKSGIEKEVIEALRDFTLRGGKRMRPIFMIMGYLLNGDNTKEVLKASILLELMQSYMLIHDDIIDESDLRRGFPTLQKNFRFNEQINIGLAIIAADLANAYCHEILLKANFPFNNIRNALLEMEKAYEMTGIGQLNDMTLLFTEKVTIDLVTKVHKLKTAEYTVNGSMKIGASLSGYQNMASIEKYAIPLGIAFQIQNDILSLFGDEQTLGKSVKSDVQEGKITHLIMFSKQNTSKIEQMFIDSVLGKKDLTDEEFEQFKELIQSSGALEKAQELKNRTKIKQYLIFPS
ncbi:MAG: polyprenyl synthetase family protein [Thermoplasmatales archaeon]